MSRGPDKFGPWDPMAPEDAAIVFCTWTLPWWIAGGWAIDLLLGHQTRAHGDLTSLSSDATWRSFANISVTGMFMHPIHPVFSDLGRSAEPSQSTSTTCGAVALPPHPGGSSR
jgi:hypothetical protein